MLRWLANLLRRRDFDELETRVRSLEWELDAFRSRVDVGPTMAEAFHAARASEAYQAAFDEPDPLVTVCVHTYDRVELLMGRCLPSILAQTHPNLEVVVVGDACTDDTGERVAALADPRVRFENLPTRGPYPEEPRQRWMVAGIPAVNRALELARGSFVTHLDDDDAYEPERVARLVELARSTRSDLVYHPFHYEDRDGTWRVNRALSFDKGKVTTSSVLYHGWLTRVPWDMAAAQYLEPGDWNRFRKLKWMGVRATRHPAILLRHYRERANRA